MQSAGIGLSRGSGGVFDGFGSLSDGTANHRSDPVAIRSICDGLPLVPAVKSMVAYLENDEAYARVMPPFLPLAETDRSLLIQRYHAVEHAASGATSMVH